MLSMLRQAALCLFAFTVLTGAIYPLAVTGLVQGLFPHQANGSLILQDGKIVGSELIGQTFASDRYFWSRPSATSPIPCNASASTGSNLGPTNPKLLESVKARADRLRAGASLPVPVDLITASGSGLDPHVSPAAALFQIHRVAQARGLREVAVRGLVLEHLERRQCGILGEPRVNVLLLNLALDETGP